MNSKNKNLPTTNYQLQTSKGFSLVEVILASSIFGLLVTALVGAYLYGQESTALSGSRTRAAIFAEEGLEAARNMRDASFGNLVSGVHGLAISGNQWTFSGSSDISGIFTRSVTTNAIDTRRQTATSSVTWTQNPQRTGQVNLATHFTDWQRDFNNWALPTQTAAGDPAGGADGNAIALYRTGASLYAILVRNASANQELAVFDVTNPAAPALVGSLELGGGADVNDVAVSGNYALLATALDSAELEVIDLTNPAAPALIGSFNASGAQNARSIAVFGTTVFIGRNSSANPEIYAISIANPTAPSQLSTAEVSGNVLDIALGQDNQYLYASTPTDSQEVSVISVSNPSAISVVGSFNASGDSDGTAIAAFSTYAALGRANGGIIIIDMSIPSSPAILNSDLDIGSRVNNLTMGVGDGDVFAATNTAATPMRIIDVSVPTAPVILGSGSASADINGIVWDFDLNRAFSAGIANTAELTVWQPS